MALTFVLIFLSLQGSNLAAQNQAQTPQSQAGTESSSGTPSQPQTPASPPSQPATSEEEIRALLKKQVADWNRGNVTAFMQGYWNSPQTEFVSSSGILRGWKTVLGRYRTQYPNRDVMGHLDFSNLEITLLGPDAALVVGHWRLKRQSDTPDGFFTLVFRKFPDGWRIINDHTSQSQ
ncbi:MAG TPA: nuclear transport factor 2 family protein [Terriglobia bacterium]